MMKLMGKAGMGAMIFATLLTTSVPAEAQRNRGWNDGGRPGRSWHRDRNDRAAAGAVLGGILGLGIGAAIASSANDRDRRDDRYREDRGYYAQPYDNDPWASRSGYAVGGVVSDGRAYDPYRR